MQQAQVIALRSSRVPKFIAELSHSNQFLKAFSVGALLVCLLSIMVLSMQITKEPVIIALGGNGKSLERIILPKAEDQIKEGIKHYLKKRYQWEPNDVIKKLKESESFIVPGSLKAFKGASAKITKFATEKLVSQKIFPESIEVDLKKQVALVKGERITSVQGLKAAGNLSLQLHFESGDRTKENPWGIYIKKETEM